MLCYCLLKPPAGAAGPKPLRPRFDGFEFKHCFIRTSLSLPGVLLHVFRMLVLILSTYSLLTLDATHYLSTNTTHYCLQHPSPCSPSMLCSSGAGECCGALESLSVLHNVHWKSCKCITGSGCSLASKRSYRIVHRRRFGFCTRETSGIH